MRGQKGHEHFGSELFPTYFPLLNDEGNLKEDQAMFVCFYTTPQLRAISK